MKKNPIHKYIKYSQLGFTLLAYVGLLGFLGYKADEYLGFDFPFLMVAGILFGFISFFAKLIIKYFKGDL